MTTTGFRRMVNAKMGLYDSFACFMPWKITNEREKGEMYRGKIYNFNGRETRTSAVGWLGEQ